jgi:hypothetical protein
MMAETSANSGVNGTEADPKGVSRAEGPGMDLAPRYTWPRKSVAAPMGPVARNGSHCGHLVEWLSIGGPSWRAYCAFSRPSLRPFASQRYGGIRLAAAPKEDA